MIGAPKVRLILDNGDQKGVVTRQEALELARKAGLDLVEVSPNVSPPVCKILNFGKYRYEMSKKMAQSKKNQHRQKVKEIKLRVGTGAADLEVKLKNVLRFLEDGDRVKLSLRFRGREVQHQHLGLELMNKIEAQFEDVAQVEQRPKLEDRQMIMVFAPKKKN